MKIAQEIRAGNVIMVGKDPMVVCADADLDRAAKGAVWGAFQNSGQTCMSVERVYVERAVYDAFVDKVVAATVAVRQDDAGGDIGSMTFEPQLETVERHLADAVEKGARVLTGGSRLDRPGLWFAPTVLVDVDHTMDVMRDETFGPVLPIMAVDSVDEAVKLANDSVYGLNSSVWTRDDELGISVANRLQAALSREVNWLLGVGLLFIVLGFGFTGYLLPWDQLALWAVTVGTNMMGYTPVLGTQVRFVLLGGKEIGGDTLLRWYVLHVLMLPFVIVIFMAIHFWRVRKDGGISGPL